MSLVDFTLFGRYNVMWLYLYLVILNVYNPVYYIHTPLKLIFVSHKGNRLFACLFLLQFEHNNNI